MNPLYAVVDATWPAAAIHRAGPWLVREGQGAGQRVSAASASGAWADSDIALAEATQDRLGQPHLFLVREGEDRLDAALAARGYRVNDPVFFRQADLSDLPDAPDPLSAFPHWPPLAIARDIWEDGHIGPARQGVMDRAASPKCAILARAGDRCTGVAFVAVAGGDAMLHALHVLPAFRRQGSAVNIMRAAARWAQDQGAQRLSVAVTQVNSAANRLYASLGMRIVGQYHYRLG